MAFKEFQRKRTHSGEPAVTISKSGTLVINSKAIEKFFEGKRYVRLFWDTEQRKIGLMPSADKRPSSYTVNLSPQGRVGTFSGIAFFRTYGIKYDQTRSLVATWNGNDGLLEVKVD